MKRLLVVTCVAVVAGCGGSGGQATFDAGQVERAFREQGIALSRLPSNGAEQTAMGMTSPCSTAYLGHAGGRTVTVWVCDSTAAAGEHPQSDTTRANVVVEIPRETPELRDRVARALRSLD